MTLRPMTMDDADKMLEWKNYPETIASAIVTIGPIKKEDHYKWLAEHLSEFRVMVKYEGEIVGAIRINNNEISIWIDRAWWKHGIATWVLQHEAERGMTAKIVISNVGAMRAFIRAGFLPKTFHEHEEVPGTRFQESKHLSPTYAVYPTYYIFQKV